MAKNINIILATTFNGGIGYKNKIPWNIPQEMKKFRKITREVNDKFKMNAIIMGRKTWESLPVKPLGGRQNVIITSNLNFKCDETAVVKNSISDAIYYCNNNEVIENIFIIGGSTLYNQFISSKTYHVNKIYLSVLFDKTIKTDTHIDLNQLIKRFDIEKDYDYLQECNSRLFASFICYNKTLHKKASI